MRVADGHARSRTTPRRFRKIGCYAGLFNPLYMKRSEHTSVEANEGDAIASVAHVLDAVEAENVARKGSQASEDARIAANTTGVLAEAAIADIVGAVFDTPYTVPLV